jgi:transposase-like protein
MRNLLAKVPRSQTEMVAATVRTIFAQPDAHSTRTQLRLVDDALRDRSRRWPTFWTRPRRTSTSTTVAPGKCSFRRLAISPSPIPSP